MKRIALVIFMLIFNFLFAQKLKLRNQAVSFSIGILDYNVQRLPASSNLDFFNYIEDYPESPDYITVKLGYSFDFSPKMTADIQLILMDDLLPDNYDISAHYFFNKRLGLGAGSMLHTNYLTGIEQFQIQSLPDYYLMDENQYQSKVYDLGFYISPALKAFDNDAFQLLVKCDLGVSSFMKKAVTFYHKKKLSNERLSYHYKTKPGFQPYIQPKVKMRLRLLKINKSSLGFLIKSNYFYSKKSIDYQRSIQVWTTDGNKNVETIQSPKHNYTGLEMQAGIYYKW